MTLLLREAGGFIPTAPGANTRSMLNRILPHSLEATLIYRSKEFDRQEGCSLLVSIGGRASDLFPSIEILICGNIYVRFLGAPLPCSAKRTEVSVDRETDLVDRGL